MPRFQVILAFLCLLAFGASVGFLSAGVPTTAPFWFLVTLITLVVSLIPKNFWGGLLRNLGRLGSGLRVRKHHAAHRITPHARSWFKKTLDVIGDGINTFSGWAWGKISSAPQLWFGILVTLLTCLVFASAYDTNNWGKFHVGLFMAYVAWMFFMGHFGQWDTLGRYIARHPVGMWLTASVTSLAITAGHGWGFFSVGLSLVSTILATIYFFGWNEKIRSKSGAGLTFVWDRLIKLLTGGYGFGAMFMTFAVIAFITMAPTVMKNNILNQQQADWVYSAAVLLVIFLIAGVILGGEKLFTTKKKK